MIEKIIEWSVNNRFMVVLATLFAILGGVFALVNIPVDAIPDLSDVQVIVYTEFSGQAPQVVEDQVTYPLTTAMLSVPFAKVVRGYSFFGYSFVYIIFEDGTDLYWARSRVLEYLNFVSGRLPAGVTPSLGPDATGVGWVYEYMLKDTSGKHDLQEMRSLQDWYLRYELTAVPGVSEVASIGGFVKQYQIEVDPNKLLAYNLPIQKVKMAIQRSNNDVGGKLVEMGETEFMVRGLGYIKSREDIEYIAVGVDKDGTPILMKNIANVQIGPELRRGVLESNGEGEVVGGIVVMRYGENALDVIHRVKAKLKALEKGLPDGVVIEVGYDRSGLIERAVETLKGKLMEEMMVVALICIIFLMHFRSAFVAIFTLPVGILISFMIIYPLGINANIMSLGGIAIAIGVMVDASVVMVENAHKHLERDAGTKSHIQIIIDASKEVGPRVVLQPFDHHGVFFAGVHPRGTVRADVQTPGLHQNLCHGRILDACRDGDSGSHDFFCAGKTGSSGTFHCKKTIDLLWASHTAHCRGSHGRGSRAGSSVLEPCSCPDTFVFHCDVPDSPEDFPGNPESHQPFFCETVPAPH